MFLLYVVGFGLFDAVLIALLLALMVHGFFMLRNRVPYVVLPDGAMSEVARTLGVRDSDVVYDLGCGDGRVILALRGVNSAAKYVGVENDWAVWLLAKWRLLSRAQLVRGEISGTPLDEATRVFAYLGPELMAELEPRFERELPQGARVVSVQFPLPTRPPAAVVELEHSRSHAARLYVYNY